MKIGSLFSGIGGFELGLEWAGLGETVWQVENNEFCQKVLAKHWPDVKKYGDIKDVGKHNLEPVDLICGGFPCQPFSVAGKRRGKSDNRFLWPEMFRVIAELHPSFVIGENVFGFVNMALDQVLYELENISYQTATLVIPACSVNATHRRDRVFVIAYSGCKHGTGFSDNREPKEQIPCKENASEFKRSIGNDEQGIITDTKRSGNRTSASEINGNTKENSEKREYPQSKFSRQNPIDSNTDSQHIKEYQFGNQFRQEGGERTSGWGFYESDWNQEWVEVATRLCRMDDGVPNRVDRLKSLGNAVVPQVSMAIGLILKEWINTI